MSRLARIKEILEETLDVEDLAVTPELSAADVDEWDSLNHIRFIVAIEDEYTIKFTTKEIADMRNIGDLMATIDAKTGG
ncbi:acyl carrier protein (plasmid) [Tistrella bauzanensis]|uniref:Acyl carrier protein n=1 Tax=Tistrella arctica TaxID=3133430 RepID=A0ABU9YRF0_9PROT